MANTHTQPWSQLILYDYNFNDDVDQFYEEDELEPDLWQFRFASRPARMNVLVKFNADGISP